MKGNERGECVLRQITSDGAGAVSDDDLRWLLDGMNYYGSNEFTDGSLTAF